MIPENVIIRREKPSPQVIWYQRLAKKKEGENLRIYISSSIKDLALFPFHHDNSNDDDDDNKDNCTDYC